MSDQCKNCVARGDYKLCVTLECWHHENWINKSRVARIKALENVLQIIIDLPGERLDEAENYALSVIGLNPPNIE